MRFEDERIRERCVFCGNPLSHMQAFHGDHCWEWRCQGAALARRWADLRDAEARRLGVGRPEAYGVVEVPVQRRAVAPLASGRKEAFRVHVLRVAAGEASPPGPAPVAAPDRATDPPDLTRRLALICAACGGMCCEAGGIHAFLDQEVLAAFAAREGGLAPGEVAERYAARVPGQCYEGSCVLQGKDGCVLPRSERGEICNRYECRALTLIRRLHRSGDTERAFVVAVDDAAGAVRSKFIGLDR